MKNLILKKITVIMLCLVMLFAVVAQTSCNDTPAETTKEATSAETTPSDTPAETESTAPETSDSETSDSETSDSETDESVSSDTETAAPETTEPETKFEDLEDYLPDNIDLGIDMSILVGYMYDEEWILGKDNGDLVGTELYNRVYRVEEALGIDLDVNIVADASWSEEVKKRQGSTDPNMKADLVSGYSIKVGSLTLSGRFQNMANSNNIDFENPWWPSSLIECSTFEDKVYFASGDISPTLIYETYAIFYNRVLTEQYNLEDPIKLVNEYKWTMDKLIEMTEGIYEDLNNNKKVDIGDFTAFNFFDDAHLKAFPYAMGVRVIENNADDGYAWSESYTGERMGTFFSKFVDWVQNNNGVTTKSVVYDPGRNFIAGTNIFLVGNFGFAKRSLGGSGLDYAVVPCPMFDEDQRAYYSTHGNPCSFWAIPTNVDLDNSAILLERLAVDAYVYITPALFERALKIKYVTSEVEGLSKMFDIIREGVVFDAGQIYNYSLSDYRQYTELASIATEWSVFFDSFTIKKMNRQIASINAILSKLP